ncbi:DMT family transporter [Priestia taiwanensis]|uniref:Multidrug SMR transporter n=1 Tax=Priestia taiwanensis TaxID=1347902 RepID=A0A917AU74_9BACI|nr:multidrug efflux SMR transporter [Priestia taiwanensis]MBM7363924.1 paired small multidrug resistance pump [Priestia taiwanensis]GGE70157.1 multidrug SMR transporter [Priestia taiwanensis]
MAWLYVFLAGFIEIFWVLGLKHADSIPMWIGVAGLIAVSFWLVIKAYDELPAGTVYAVFTGMGTVGIVIVDIVFFDAPVSIAKLALLALLLTGIIGLKRLTGSSASEDGEKEVA